MSQDNADLIAAIDRLTERLAAASSAAPKSQAERDAEVVRHELQKLGAIPPEDLPAEEPAQSEAEQFVQQLKDKAAGQWTSTPGLAE